MGDLDRKSVEPIAEAAGVSAPHVAGISEHAEAGRPGRRRPPEILHREHWRDKARGRRRKLPSLKVRNAPAVEVRNILMWSPVLRAVPWERYRVRDGTKGTLVLEAKRIAVLSKDERCGGDE